MNISIDKKTVENLKKKYGPAVNLIPFHFLEKNERNKTIINEEKAANLSSIAFSFYQSWKKLIFDPSQSMNGGGACLSCYTFLTKGGVALVRTLH